MRQASRRGSSRGGVCRVCVDCALDSHLGRLADEVVLNPTGHQVHHISCRMSASQRHSGTPSQLLP